MSDKTLFDRIIVCLVPKLVDSNPEIFDDKEQYWHHSFGLANLFLKKLPD